MILDEFSAVGSLKMSKPTPILCKKQQGSALLIILVILMVSAALGVSLVQSSITSERIAGNYRYVVQADMAAQAGAIERIRELRGDGETPKTIGEIYDEFTGRNDLLDKEDIKGKTGAELWKLIEETTGEENIIKSEDKKTEYIYGFYKDQGQIILVVIARYVIGDDHLAYSYSQPVFIVIGLDPDLNRRKKNSNNDADNQPAMTYADLFPSPVAACEGVAVGGGSIVAYFDSREGAWTGSALPTDEVVIRALTNENANIRLHGNEKIYGSVQAIGYVEMTGSSEIFGSVQANGNINLNGNVDIHRDATAASSVVFGSSGRVHGNVIAQEGVEFKNWSARVNGFLRTGGSIKSNRNPVCDHVGGSCISNDESLTVPQIPALDPSDCDVAIFDEATLKERASYLKDQIASSGSLNLNSNNLLNATVTDAGLKKFRRDGILTETILPKKVDFMGETVSFYRFDSLTVGSDGGLEIPKNAGRVFILIDGNLTFGGGGKGLIIGENSSLTFIVGGKTDIGSVVKMKDNNNDPIKAITDDGYAVLNILSYYDNYSGSYSSSWDSKANVAVTLGGSSLVVGNIYAPYGNVYIGNGSHLYGAVFGKSVATAGNGRVIFDKAIMEAGLGGGNIVDDPDGSGDGKSITGWR